MVLILCKTCASSKKIFELHNYMYEKYGRLWDYKDITEENLTINFINYLTNLKKITFLICKIKDEENIDFIPDKDYITVLFCSTNEITYWVQKLNERIIKFISPRLNILSTSEETETKTQCSDSDNELFASEQKNAEDCLDTDSEDGSWNFQTPKSPRIQQLIQEEIIMDGESNPHTKTIKQTAVDKNQEALNKIREEARKMREQFLKRNVVLPEQTFQTTTVRFGMPSKKDVLESEDAEDAMAQDASDQGLLQ